MTATVAEEQIALRRVTLTLGTHRVLRDVSVTAMRGETTVILGASGSGKTTILRLILGLYRADSGAILIGGRDITGLTERELMPVRLEMAMVFQGAALFDSLTVGENVGYRLWEQRTVSDHEIESRVRRSLTYVGLEDTIGKMPAELSGGMRKRVGIARALASGAQTILYDEPTAGLDPINTCMTARLIKGLKSQGLTQIVVTHDLDTAHAVADRIVVVDRGRVIFEGSPEDLKASPLPAIQTFLDPSLLAAKGVFPRPELGEWGETP